MGIVPHWNFLIQMCDTPYFVMASDDDEWEPWFLSEVDDLLQKYPNVGLVHAKISRIWKDGSLIHTEQYDYELDSCSEYISHLFSGTLIHCMQNNVFRTDIVKSAGGCVDMPVAWFSDDATTILASSNGVAYTRRPSFRFRQSDINTSGDESRKLSKKKVMACVAFKSWLADRFPLEVASAEKYIEAMAKHSYRTLSLWDFITKFYLLKKIKASGKSNLYWDVIKLWIGTKCIKHKRNG